jgi:acetyltransferase
MEGAQGFPLRLMPAPVGVPAGAWLQIADGRRVWVRAIGPQDAPAEQQFFSNLSPNSRYRRFLLSARSVPEPVLRALTAVDQHRHVAFVALAIGSESGELEAPIEPPIEPRIEPRIEPPIVADARYVWENDGCSAEFAIAVADDWQRQGLGARLLRQLIEHARHAGVQELFGYVLAENLPMQALVRSLGGRIVAHAHDEALRLARLDLRRTRLISTGAWQVRTAACCPS